MESRMCRVEQIIFTERPRARHLLLPEDKIFFFPDQSVDRDDDQKLKFSQSQR